jgi:hypothetical protein
VSDRSLLKWTGPLVVAFAVLSLWFSVMTAKAPHGHALGGVASSILFLGFGGYFCSLNESLGQALLRLTLLLTACIAALGVAFVIAFVHEEPVQVFLHLAAFMLLLSVVTAKMARI